MGLAEINSPLARRLRAPRLIEVVLVLSFGLNLFVAGGFVYSRWEGPRGDAPMAPDRRLAMIAERIGIDPQTSKPFKELRRSFRTEHELLAAQNHPLTDEMWEELAAPQPDDQHLQGLLDQMAVHRRAFQGGTTTALVHFLATLTPPQRTAFTKLMEDRKDPIGNPLRNNLGK